MVITEEKSVSFDVEECLLNGMTDQWCDTSVEAAIARFHWTIHDNPEHWDPLRDEITSSQFDDTSSYDNKWTLVYSKKSFEVFLGLSSSLSSVSNFTFRFHLEVTNENGLTLDNRMGLLFVIQCG